MPGLCRPSGCCLAPLLFRCEGGRGGQGDGDQLSHEDQLESGRAEKSQESHLVEEVSVREGNDVLLTSRRLTQ